MSTLCYTFNSNYLQALTRSVHTKTIARTQTHTQHCICNQNTTMCLNTHTHTSSFRCNYCAFVGRRVYFFIISVINAKTPINIAAKTLRFTVSLFYSSYLQFTSIHLLFIAANPRFSLSANYGC